MPEKEAAAQLYFEENAFPAVCQGWEMHPACQFVISARQKTPAGKGSHFDQHRQALEIFFWVLDKGQNESHNSASVPEERN